MRRPRLLSLTLVCLFVAFVSVLLTAQSRTAPSTSQVRFATAVGYGSGGQYTRSVVVADLNGDGVPDIVLANEVDGIGVLLGNGDGTFQTAVTYLSGGSIANSVAAADMNGDGIPDIVVADDYNVAVLLGNGDGTLQAAVTYGSGGIYATSVAVADLNGDGTPDIVVGNKGSGNVGVLLGNGDGTFRAAVTYFSGGSIAYSVAIADLNGDGIPDIVVANYCGDADCETNGTSGTVGVLLGNGDGTFQAAVTYGSGGYGADSVAVTDVNGDGIPDLVVANFCSACANGSVGVLLGNGNGSFQSAVTYNSGANEATSIAVADVDGDGTPDILVANQCAETSCDGSVGILLGNGDGTFQPSVIYGSAGDAALWVIPADLNGDGKPDIVVANDCSKRLRYQCKSGSVGVLLNKFTASTSTTITSSLNPSQVGQPVTFTATVTSSDLVPDGSTVVFYEGAAEIGTATTANGVATLTTSFSKAKTSTIKATYPKAAFLKASSGTVRQVVKN